MGAAPALTPNVTHTGFPGDDFSNNLFTDLAPLLALFGDQMTKQFLGMSMGWLDNAMLAICPVGILTVMVSAIRIGGTSKLKTLIGRARESRSTAELELLSATSGEVCEMWSGSEIVRVAGQPATFQYILNKAREPETIMTLSEALKQKFYRQSSNQTDVEIPSVAPNLTLNVRGAIPLSWESLTIFMIGTIIQVMILVLSAFTVYLWSWRAGSNMISSYGFPCYLVGTILLTFGLLGCARVIQRSSRVHELVPGESADALSPSDVPAKYQPLCVQKACTVDDKHFLSYAIFHPEGQSAIKVSRSNGQDYNVVTSCSTVVALIGYVCQFIGLRAMHWSVALMQLGATLTMTCARAFIGRGLANPPIYQPLPTGNEAAGIAYLLREAKAWELVTGTSSPIMPAHSTLSYVENICPRSIVTPLLYESEETVADSNPSNDLIMTAKSIGKTVPMDDSTLLLAQQLVNAIRATMTICSLRHADGVLDGNFLDCNEHRWAIQPLLRKNEGNVDHLPITTLCSSSSPGRVEMSKEAQENSVLTADSGTMAAILSLWLAVLGHRYPLSEARPQDENETARRPQCYRIISNDRILVLLGHAIGKWLSPQTSLHTALSEERQGKNAPIFGISLSSRYSRFRGLADQTLNLIGEPIADAIELDVLRFSDPSVSSTRIMRMLGQREFHPSVKDTEREDNDFAFLRGLTLPEMQASLMRDFHKGTNNVTTEVAVLSSSSLERNCAQELFTLFILSFTSQIWQVKGRTTKITGPDGETWTNDVFSEIASAVVLAGLAEDEAEALTLVVPAFAARGLLPTELS